MDTKACSLTDDEIRALIKVYANELTEENIEESLERMSYLNRRLKAEKKEVEIKPNKLNETQADAIGNASKGW